MGRQNGGRDGAITALVPKFEPFVTRIRWQDVAQIRSIVPDDFREINRGALCNDRLGVW